MFFNLLETSQECSRSCALTHLRILTFGSREVFHISKLSLFRLHSLPLLTAPWGSFPGLFSISRSNPDAVGTWLYARSLVKISSKNPWKSFLLFKSRSCSQTSEQFSPIIENWGLPVACMSRCKTLGYFFSITTACTSPCQNMMITDWISKV